MPGRVSRSVPASTTSRSSRGRDDGMLTLTVRSRSVRTSIRPELARRLVERGCAVHEISPRLMSLEDLFVDILAKVRAERGGTGGVP